MSRRFLIPLAILALFTVAACNDDKQDPDDEYKYTLSSDVAVTAFSLNQNSKVLDSLQNVFFSIDLLGARIFNADSLPYGTPVDKLVVNISTNSASKVVLYIPRPQMTDSIVDYKSNSTDSVDFSNGPVRLSITSENGAVERTYSVSVNVHKVKADTLAWSMLQSAQLPSTIAVPAAQFTAKMGDSFYTVTSSADGRYCLSTTSDPDAGAWTTTEFTPGFTPVVTSLRSAGASLYMLGDDHQLYASADGLTWTSTGASMTYLYGAYGDEILGYRGGSVAAYPSGKEYAVPQTFPARGTSLPAEFAPAMALSSQIVILGGVAADGTRCRDAWGFDGNSWARMSVTSNLPAGTESPVLVAYDLFDVPSSTWSPVRYPALVAFGGLTDDGTVSRTVYISKDWGISWRVAPELMALPEEVPALYGQAAFIYDVTMHASPASASKAWTPARVRALYPFATFDIPGPRRVSAPVTEWECPGIYLFGGMDAAGAVSTQVWRGVISRYTFKPVQ